VPQSADYRFSVLLGVGEPASISCFLFWGLLAVSGCCALSGVSSGVTTPYKHKNGLWCAQYTVHTAEGRERKTLYGKTRQEVATAVGNYGCGC
jgi:hypothetical protein